MDFAFVCCFSITNGTCKISLGKGSRSKFASRFIIQKEHNKLSSLLLSLLSYLYISDGFTPLMALSNCPRTTQNCLECLKVLINGKVNTHASGKRRYS